MEDESKPTSRGQSAGTRGTFPVLKTTHSRCAGKEIFISGAALLQSFQSLLAVLDPSAAGDGVALDEINVKHGYQLGGGFIDGSWENGPRECCTTPKAPIGTATRVIRAAIGPC